MDCEVSAVISRNQKHLDAPRDCDQNQDFFDIHICVNAYYKQSQNLAHRRFSYPKLSFYFSAYFEQGESKNTSLTPTLRILKDCCIDKIFIVFSSNFFLWALGFRILSLKKTDFLDHLIQFNFIFGKLFDWAHFWFHGYCFFMNNDVDVWNIFMRGLAWKISCIALALYFQASLEFQMPKVNCDSLVNACQPFFDFSKNWIRGKISPKSLVLWRKSSFELNKPSRKNKNWKEESSYNFQ